MRRLLHGLAALACLASAASTMAQVPVTTQATLLDRVQIEDLITSYYYNLGAGGSKVFLQYYVEDADFDLNGKMFHGQAAIEKAYADLGTTSPARKGATFHMLLGNPLIRVTGDTATAEFLWTGVINDTVKAPPRLLEQGREYDLLVKRGGEWRIKKRTIISDAALDDQYDAVYQPRKDYDISRAR